MCCLFFVFEVWCLAFVVCCVLIVSWVCYSLFVACCLLFDGGCLMVVVGDC